MTEQKIEIYQNDEGTPQLEVVLENDTVWLTQKQMSDVFGTTPENILMHLKNIYKDQELQEKATTKDFLVVREEGKRQVKRSLKHYDLDAIISVGYRVNSKRGVQFRVWATSLLKEHLINGYTLNQQRFDKNSTELQQALALIKKAAQSPQLNNDEGRGLVEIISRYTQTFLWLQRYDEGLLNDQKGQSGGELASSDDAMKCLNDLKAQLIERGEATDLFANLGVMV